MVTPNAPSESPLSAASLDATLAQQAPDEGAPREPGVGPRLGRFTILERIGAGNMGVVFTAYDDVLDRKIAVKVLRGGGEGASLRLLREAQAMARVAHPNVVTVHEVGTSLDQVYVAMEFIRGVTLQVWQREPGRAWTDIVDAYAQAGRGLQAAHAAGLIHRDFKPANAMIDADGRVRVLDFGLVRSQIELQQPLTDASASRHLMSVQLTQAGDVLGTPAYMSPEQIRGLEIGPAADQFSLCVSLYEGLYGALPFAGDSFAALFRSIQRHRLPDPPRNSKVPTWLRAVLLRGLHPVPEDRYPSIAALLRALGAGSAKRRRVGVGVGVGAVAAAALVGFLAARAQGPELCGGAEARLRGVWGPEQRVAVERSLSAAGPAFAAEVAPQVLRELESYVGAWTVAHRDACMAHSRGEQSDQLLDRRMVCLEQRKAALAAAVGVLSEKDEEVAREALRVVHDLPAIDRCNDATVLAAEVDPPTDPAMVAAVAEVRSELARAETLAHAGKVAEAMALAEAAVQAAMRSGYRPVEAEALLAHSSLAANTQGLANENDQRAYQAMLIAIDRGMDEVAAEAAALRVFVRAGNDDTVTSALDDAPLAEALAGRLPRPEAMLGLLANNIGTVHLRLDRPADAQRAFELALARRSAALDADDPELANTLANLAMVEPAGPRREAHLQQGIAILSKTFGPGHPRTLDLQIAAARRHLDQPLSLEIIESATHRLDREAENVGNLLVPERKIEGVGRSGGPAILLDQPRGHIEQEVRELLGRRHPAEQQQPAPGAIQLGERAFQQLVLQLGMRAGEAVEIAAGEGAYMRIRQRGDIMLGARAERTSDEIGRIDHAHDLLPSIGERSRELEHAIDDIGDQERILAFPHQGLPRHQLVMTSHFTQQRDFIHIQRGTNRTVADDTGRTMIHKVP